MTTPPEKPPATHLATLGALVETFRTRGTHAPALIAFGPDDETAISYARLHEEIRLAAAQLQALGLTPGARVLLWAPNSPAWIAHYFAIVCAGATAVPIDHQLPTADATRILRHSAPTLIVSTSEHLPILEQAALGRDTTVVLLDDLLRSATTPATAAAELEWPPIRPEQPASLLYTSGTTGTPKAVPLTHGNFAANLEALLAAALVTPRDRVLVPLPLHHTYPFTVGLLTVLGAGATVVLPAGISGPEITRAAKEAKATALIAVPRLCTALVAGIDAGVRARGRWPGRLFDTLLAFSIALRRRTGLRLGRYLFRSLHARVGPQLRMIGCGGAKLDPTLAWTLEGLGWQVLTGYGLTETSPVLTFNARRHARLGTEGVPLPGVEVTIEPIPHQAHGEILARGPNVFAGYWHNPEATRTAFTDSGWFRTGDLGWFDPDGFLHIAGRSKEVIVLADGKNVNPEDVEAVLKDSPLFRELAVLEQAGALVALVVPDAAAIRSRGSLRQAELLREELEHLSAALPAYQRIRDYRVSRNPLPRTPLGKLKRHLLPELYDQADVREAVPHSVELSDTDRTLIETGLTGDVWRWLQSRFPDHVLSLDTSPQLDLKIDSLEWVTLTLELDRRFDLRLTGDAVSRIVCLRDLLSEVTAAAAKPRQPRTGEARLAAPNALQHALGTMLLGINHLLMRSAFRLRVRGAQQLPARGPFVLAPNHASYLDPPAVAAALPWRVLQNTYWAGWVGKMYAGPISRLVSRATRVIPVDPDHDLTDAIVLARTALERGHALVWFPEGRRSPDGTLQRLQPGLGAVLTDANARVVPVAVTGSFAAWPRQRRWPRLRPLTVTFGAPLTVAELRRRGQGDTDIEQVAQGLHEALAALLRTAEADDAQARSSG